jgi:hypothetical protein
MIRKIYPPLLAHGARAQMEKKGGHCADGIGQCFGVVWRGQGIDQPIQCKGASCAKPLPGLTVEAQYV